MDSREYYSPNSFVEGQHQSYYSKENVLNMSFQQSYNNKYMSTHITCDMAYSRGVYSDTHDMYSEHDRQVYSEHDKGDVYGEHVYNEHDSHSIYNDTHHEHDAEYHAYNDMSDTNDSGVTSEDTEQYNDDTNHNDADDNLNTKNTPVRQTTTNHSEPPLSAWKAKQLKLSTAGVIKRRRDANARERKRMNGLNEAFERLREHVPGVTNQTNKKLSKMDTLQMANIYIRQLADLLNKSA